jgi:hypothetical protein
MKTALLFIFVALSSSAQTNPVALVKHLNTVSNSPSEAFQAQSSQNLFIESRVEQIRINCIENRRIICGKIIKVLPDGLVVDSGYTNLMSPPLNLSWFVPGAVTSRRAVGLVEGNRPDSVCIGPVFLTDWPKKPVAKVHDYVDIVGFPTGQYVYTSVGNVKRCVQKFSAKLVKAIQWKVDGSGKQNAPLK